MNMGAQDMGNVSATSVCPLFYIRGHLLKKTENKKEFAMWVYL